MGGVSRTPPPGGGIRSLSTTTPISAPLTTSMSTATIITTSTATTTTTTYSTASIFTTHASNSTTVYTKTPSTIASQCTGNSPLNLPPVTGSHSFQRQNILNSTSNVSNSAILGSTESYSPCAQTTLQNSSKNSPNPTTQQTIANLKENNQMLAAKVNVLPTTSQAQKSVSEIEKSQIQTGLDRYILVTKRKANARSPRKEPNAKFLKGNNSVSQNPFSILSVEDSNIENQNETVKSHKPPPIYLREQTSNVLVNKLSHLLGKDNFHVVSLRKGNVFETKIVTYKEILYKKVVEVFNTENRKYYTYQLKSSKGLVVVVKGLDSSVPTDEIKDELEKEGFEVKSITNLPNKDKVPQPLFKIELTYESSLIKKKGSTHPIYDLRFLCHRRIRVEEPYKRKEPPQCQNCQEFGHTKTYCKLPSVCVRCGDVHNSLHCPHPKEDANIKKCSNCGENHTANYRGCRVYAHLKNTPSAARKINYAKYTPSSFPRLMPTASTSNGDTQLPINPTSQSVSYSNALKNNDAAIHQTYLQNSIDKLIQAMSSFMANMQTMMQEMMRNQSMLMQILIKQK